MENTRLEDLREGLDINKKELAKIFGVSGSVYSRWEIGRVAIPLKRLVQIANYYKINIDYIMKLTNVKEHIESSDDIDLDIIAERIKEIRNDLDLSTKEFAKKLKISPSVISSYEHGSYLIITERLIKICKLSNYSIDYVLGRTNNKKINK